MNEDEMMVKTEESELKTTAAIGIGHFVNQNIIRADVQTTKSIGQSARRERRMKC
jgi:hypothetical protein